MDGWMDDGWMDGWMMDGWMDGWMDGYKHTLTNPLSMKLSTKDNQDIENNKNDKLSLTIQILYLNYLIIECRISVNPSWVSNVAMSRYTKV